jgi:hypothetical protein
LDIFFGSTQNPALVHRKLDAVCDAEDEAGDSTRTISCSTGLTLKMILTSRTANAIGKYLMTMIVVEPAQFLCFEYLKKRVM